MSSRISSPGYRDMHYSSRAGAGSSTPEEVIQARKRLRLLEGEERRERMREMDQLRFLSEGFERKQRRW